MDLRIILKYISKEIKNVHGSIFQLLAGTFPRRCLYTSSPTPQQTWDMNRCWGEVTNATTVHFTYSGNVTRYSPPTNQRPNCSLGPWWVLYTYTACSRFFNSKPVTSPRAHIITPWDIPQMLFHFLSSQWDMPGTLHTLCCAAKELPSVPNEIETCLSKLYKPHYNLNSIKCGMVSIWLLWAWPYIRWGKKSAVIRDNNSYNRIPCPLHSSCHVVQMPPSTSLPVCASPEMTSYPLVKTNNSIIIHAIKCVYLNPDLDTILGVCSLHRRRLIWWQKIAGI